MKQRKRKSNKENKNAIQRGYRNHIKTQTVEQAGPKAAFEAAMVVEVKNYAGVGKNKKCQQVSKNKKAKTRFVVHRANLLKSTAPKGIFNQI